MTWVCRPSGDAAEAIHQKNRPENTSSLLGLDPGLCRLQERYPVDQRVRAGIGLLIATLLHAEAQLLHSSGHGPDDGPSRGTTATANLCSRLALAPVRGDEGWHGRYQKLL
jgi:hypothetical protein